jgi:hypothetical protein
MLRLILLVPAAALLVFAGEGIYYAARGRQAVAVGCDALLRDRPQSPRLLVTGCEINYAGAGYRESGGQVEELFLPARPVGGQALPAPIVIATRDRKAIALARSAFGGGRAVTPEQSLEAMRKVVTVLRVSPAIEGLARTGFIERLRTQRILSRLPPPIGEHALVVDLDGRPDFLRPGLALAGGMLLGLIAVWPRRRNRMVTDATSPATARPSLVDGRSNQHDPECAFDEGAEREAMSRPHHVPARTAAPPPAVSVALPRLLLLALDVASGPEAIETAPPLGSRAEVIAILMGVIPDLAADARHLVLARPDGSVKLNLGPHDPIPTAVIEATGESGVALVKEVLLMTGWRAFSPKTGLFMSVEDLDALAALAAEGPVV